MCPYMRTFVTYSNFDDIWMLSYMMYMDRMGNDLLITWLQHYLSYWFAYWFILMIVDVRSQQHDALLCSTFNYLKLTVLLIIAGGHRLHFINFQAGGVHRSNTFSNSEHLPSQKLPKRVLYRSTVMLSWLIIPNIRTNVLWWFIQLTPPETPSFNLPPSWNAQLPWKVEDKRILSLEESWVDA